MAINYHDGGGNNPYVPDFTNINVVPGDLAEFAGLLDSDLKALSDTWTLLKGQLLTEAPPSDAEPPRPLDPNFAGAQSSDSPDGILEARAFRRAYVRTVDAEVRLMEDLIKGLEILRDGARMIHDGYVTSDAANATAVEGAFTAYEPWSVVNAFRELTQPDPADTRNEHG